MFKLKNQLSYLISFTINKLEEFQDKYLTNNYKNSKVLDPKLFLEKGILQEANRLFFHPRGLSLTVSVDINKITNEKIVRYGVVYDYTDIDDIGGEYAFNKRNKDQLSTALRKAQYSQELLNKFKDKRIEKFGDVVEPISEYYRR